VAVVDGRLAVLVADDEVLEERAAEVAADDVPIKKRRRKDVNRV